MKKAGQEQLVPWPASSIQIRDSPLLVPLHPRVADDAVPIQPEGKVVGIALGVHVGLHVAGHVFLLRLHGEHVFGELHGQQSAGLGLAFHDVEDGL